MEIGVLAFQGSVIEHTKTVQEAARMLGIECRVAEVRTKSALESLDGLIIPGGESTTMYKLCEREGMLEAMREVPALFGTCAGAIMLAKRIHNEEAGQKTLALMDIEIDRNAYGTQTESFEETIETALGRINAVFIRAPRIKSIGAGVLTLAKRGSEVVACEQRAGKRYYLAACFHPELSTTLFHAHFIRALL
jgi:pyridoxal 5'-phosphate synthase pdxT subunit